MNNTKTITIAVMALIITMSIGIISSQKASALTNVERFHVGINFAASVADLKFGAAPGASISTDPPVKKATLAALSSLEFQTHSDAYRNGYISEIDFMYGLNLPYVSYEYQSGNGGPVVITPHYMGITILNH